MFEYIIKYFFTIAQYETIHYTCINKYVQNIRVAVVCVLAYKKWGRGSNASPDVLDQNELKKILLRRLSADF